MSISRSAYMGRNFGNVHRDAERLRRRIGMSQSSRVSTRRAGPEAC